MTDCKNCEMTDEYCASGDCQYDILKEYEAHQTQVPSYDSWQKHKKVTAETQIKNCDLEIINKKLKKLLKEIRDSIAESQLKLTPEGFKLITEIVTKIDEVLK